MDVCNVDNGMDYGKDDNYDGGASHKERPWWQPPAPLQAEEHKYKICNHNKQTHDNHSNTNTDDNNIHPKETHILLDNN